MAVAAAVLAAGRGVRFGAGPPKPLAPFGGRPLLAWALDAATAAGLAPVVCVVSDEAVAAAVPAPVTVLRNPDPDRGISSSLRIVLEYLGDVVGVEAVVVGPADQPLIGSEAWRRVGAVGDDLAVATYAGRRANPVRIARTLWAEAVGLRGDEGARVLIRRHGATGVVCDDAGDPADADTPADLAALERRWRSQTASG